MKSIIIAIVLIASANVALASRKACRQVTIMRALSIVDRDNQTKNDFQDVRKLYRMVCNNINPSSDIYYDNGVKAFSVKAQDWYFYSDKFAVLANGEGDVMYPNGIKAFSKKAVDWFYPSDKIAFLDAALTPGLEHPMYYPNGIKALSEKARDWFYPSNKLAFLHKALGPKGSEDMFYPNGVKAYSKRADDWHYSDDTFAFMDDGSNKLETLRDLSDVRPSRLEFRRMRKLRILFTLYRIDRAFN